MMSSSDWIWGGLKMSVGLVCGLALWTKPAVSQCVWLYHMIYHYEQCNETMWLAMSYVLLLWTMQWNNVSGHVKCSTIMNNAMIQCVWPSHMFYHYEGNNETMCLAISYDLLLWTMLWYSVSGHLICSTTMNNAMIQCVWPSDMIYYYKQCYDTMCLTISYDLLWTMLWYNVSVHLIWSTTMTNTMKQCVWPCHMFYHYEQWTLSHDLWLCTMGSMLCLTDWPITWPITMDTWVHVIWDWSIQSHTIYHYGQWGPHVAWDWLIFIRYLHRFVLVHPCFCQGLAGSSHVWSQWKDTYMSM